ncbi:MAG: CorA family divalent cation transporter [Erysipelotrichaceae bacterium]|nr:CorA family divalent cation transporter [Erysipelotrichaceae bacterium]
MYGIKDNHLVLVDQNRYQDSKDISIYLIDSDTKDLDVDYFDDYFQDNHERVKFCKAEEHFRYLSGTIVIPIKNQFPDQHKFAFCIKENLLLLIDDDHLLAEILERLSQIKFYNAVTPGRFLADIIEIIIEKDLDYLELLESKITMIEDEVLDNKITDFNLKMTVLKRETLVYFNFYNQLVDMLETLREDLNDRFNIKDRKYFNSIMQRCSRLQANTQLIRDYSKQVTEEYQMTIDLHLNSVMKILTVVTSVLMPLTLITGWYGMNFKSMPELEWKYGYLMVFVISAVVLVACLWWSKKKKFI